jgi:hypothetical protein
MKITKTLLLTLFTLVLYTNFVHKNIVSWGRKAVCLRLFEERGKGTNLRLPREFDNYPQAILVGKTSITALLCAWSPNE